MSQIKEVELRIYKDLNTLRTNTVKDSIYFVFNSTTQKVSQIWVTNKNNVPKQVELATAVDITNTDGNLKITGTTINVSNSLLATINSALQSGDDISSLINDANYITLADIPTFIPSDYDLEDFTNISADPFVHISEAEAIASNLVPYTGANQDVDLGEFQLKAGQIELDQTPTGTFSTAKIRWNDTAGTAEIRLKGNNVTLQLGQELVKRVVNKTVTNITLQESNYQAVKIVGATGQRLSVDLAQADSEINSSTTIGLVTENIANNQEGFITFSGEVNLINTTGSLQGETWADGDVLYLSPTVAGQLTKVAPTAPNHTIKVGYVQYAHAIQGKIHVDVDTGYSLNNLHNVAITGTTANKVLGSVTEGLWENKTIGDILGYEPASIEQIYDTKTITEINALIASNSLVKGALYKITGCQTSLYGGTDLYLIALETNKLDKKGVGKFFNPKYENISGNGIWTGYVECGVSTIVGLFDVNELITANNGATGQLFGNVNGGFITPLTGTWSTATSITGNASGATAVISSVSVPLTYAIGDKTIWGGYHWSNLTGTLGSKVDDFNLDATNWVKVAYNTTDYNLSFDEIGFDITNDFISYRNDNLGNEISYSYVDFTYFSTIWGIALSTIKTFQWGNAKVLGNNLKTSLVNILNFRGSDIQNLTFTQNSIISGNTFGKGSKLLNSLLQYGAILNSVFGKDSVISNSNFRQSSNIQISTFGEGSSINDILNQGSRIINVVFCKNAKIQKCTFNINTGIDNVTLKQNKLITSTIFESNSSLNSIDLSSATVIFEPFSKTVFARANDGVRKIRYYNNNNVLVIADITD